MITALVGLMGSGKSYEAAVYHIYNALKSGRRVVTNIPMNREYLAGILGFHIFDLLIVLEPRFKDDGSLYTPFEQIDDYYSDWMGWDNENKRVGTLFVIDEIQLYLPSEKTDLAKQAMAVATMQRHRGEDWIIITQDINNIYKPIARLVAYLHYFESNKSLFGLTNRYKHFVYRGSTRSKETRIKASPLKKFDKSKFIYYKSHTQSDGEVDEVNIESTRVNLFKYGLYMLLAIALLIYLLYGFKENVMNKTSVSDVAAVSVIDEEIIQDENKPGGFIGLVSENTEAVAYDFDNVTVTKKTIIRTSEDKSNIVRTIAPVETVEIERETVKTIKEYKKAPLQDFVIQIFGHIQYGKSKMFIYRVYNNSGAYFEMKEIELNKLGYVIIKSGDCVQLLDHPNVNNPSYITCHVPKFEEKDEKQMKKKDKDGKQEVKVKTPVGEL